VENKQIPHYYKDEALLKYIGERTSRVRNSKQMSQEALAKSNEQDYYQINPMELGMGNYFKSHFSRIAKTFIVDPNKRLL